MQYKFALIIGSGLCSNIAFANCESYSSNDILEKIKSNHPAFVREASVTKLNRLNSQINQSWFRPEVELEVIKGDDLEGEVESYKLAFTQDLGFLKSRSNQKEINEIENNIASLQSLKSKERVIVQSVLDFYQLKHLKEIIPYYEETKKSYQVVKSINNRKQYLSPDEIVENTTLAIALNELELKINSAQAQIEYIEGHINYFAKEKCKLSLKNLPENFDVTKVKLHTGQASIGTDLKMTKLEGEFHKANLEKEIADNSYSFKVGPSIEVEKINGNNYNKYGIALTIDLPSYSKSRLMSKSKNALEDISIIDEKAKIDETGLDLNLLVQKFNHLSKIYTGHQKNDLLNKKHQEIDNLFNKGSVSTSILIDTHSKLLEYVETQQSFEKELVETLWTYYSYTNDVLNKAIR